MMNFNKCCDHRNCIQMLAFCVHLVTIMFWVKVIPIKVDPRKFNNFNNNNCSFIKLCIHMCVMLVFEGNKCIVCLLRHLIALYS